MRINVISPNELDPASENPNGAGTLLYLFTKSSISFAIKSTPADFNIALDILPTLIGFLDDFQTFLSK